MVVVVMTMAGYRLAAQLIVAALNGMKQASFPCFCTLLGIHTLVGLPQVRLAAILVITSVLIH